MTRLPLDLETLRLLTRIDAEGSLGRAASGLRISQQAASVRVVAAERTVGRSLVRRARAGSSLTEDGRLVVEWAAPLLAAADRFGAALQTLAAAGGALEIAASQTISETLMPEWVAAVRSGPGAAVDVRLTSGNSAAVLEQVRSARARLGFIETPEAVDDLHSLPIAADALVLIVAPDHAWAARAEPVSAAELAATPMVVRESGSGTRRTLELALAAAGQHGPAASPIAQLSTSAAIRAAVAAGVAPAAISLALVADDLRARRLIRVPVDVDLRRVLRAVWSGTLAPDARHFLAVAAGGLPAEAG